MKEFNWLNYHTCYQYRHSSNGNWMPHNAACFANFFNNCKDGYSEIEVKVYSGIKKAKSNHLSNACLFNKFEIERHMDEAKKLFDFEYVVTRKRRVDNFWYWSINIKIDQPILYKKYLLTWLRYLYEYPYNMALLDAYRLKEMPEYSEISIPSLHIVTLNALSFGSGHAAPLPRRGPLYTDEQLKSRLGELLKNHDLSLNDIYRKEISVAPRISSERLGDLEYWMDAAEFLIRVDKYKTALNRKENYG